MDAECIALCRRVFAMDPPPGCTDAYRRAHATVFAASPAAPVTAERIDEAVRRGWDLEALEFASRLKDKNGALSKKFNILFYVVEASPRGYALFVNERSTPLVGWGALVRAVLITPYKLLKGLYLWRRLATLHADDLGA